MDTTKIYLEFSKEEEELLNSNNLTVSDILKEAGIEADVEYGVIPSNHETARTKDIVPIIIAASTSIVSISYAITMILSVIYKRPRLVKIYENELIRDENQAPILDKEGNLQYRKIEKYQLFEGQDDKMENFEFKTNLKDGVVLKITSDTNKK